MFLFLIKLFTFSLIALGILHGSPVISTWVKNDGAANDTEVIVLLKNGNFFWAQDGPRDADPSGYGTYIIEPDLNEVHLALDPWLSNDAGFSSFSRILDGETGSAFQRLPDQPGSLIGGWADPPSGTRPETTAFVFLENGRYFSITNGRNNRHSPMGFESGKYVYDHSTQELSISEITLNTGSYNGFNGGFSWRPSSKKRAAVEGDDLVIYYDFYREYFKRSGERDRTAEGLSALAGFRRDDLGNLGFYLKRSTPGFHYGVIHGRTLQDVASQSFAFDTHEGDGLPSDILISNSLAWAPSQFFKITVDPVTAISPADLPQFLDGKTIDGHTFSSTGRWTSQDDSGNCTTRPLFQFYGNYLCLTSDSFDNDSSRYEVIFSFTFGYADLFERVPLLRSLILDEVQVNQYPLVLNLSERNPPPVLSYEGVIASITRSPQNMIAGFKLSENGSYSSADGSGRWFYESIDNPDGPGFSRTDARLSFVPEGESPFNKRTDLILHFTSHGQLTEINTTHTQIEGGMIVGSKEITVNLILDH